MNGTPQANRVHIAILGRRNVGKSSLLNALTDQDLALVSDVPGTTTDPVLKSVELHPIGACVLIDTAGFDDVGALGQQRVARTREMLQKTDIAVLCFHETITAFEHAFVRELQALDIKTLFVLTQCDDGATPALAQEIEATFGHAPLPLSARTGFQLDALRKRLSEMLPGDEPHDGIVGKYVQPNDVVLLLMPQDPQAPKGRLILPQVQTIRDLLERACTVVCVAREQYLPALEALKSPPALIITDSQIFDYAYAHKPPQSKLTSFSVLFAIYKGDIDTFRAGAERLDTLREGDHVLIAEACTHNPLDGDIGRVKIPNLLRNKVGPGLHIDVCTGKTFPEDLRKYALIIHCGACMFTRRYVLGRVRAAAEQGIPMTNYGLTIAKLRGILDKVTL